MGPRRIERSPLQAAPDDSAVWEVSSPPEPATMRPSPDPPAVPRGKSRGFGRPTAQIFLAQGNRDGGLVIEHNEDTVTLDDGCEMDDMGDAVAQHVPIAEWALG